MSFSFIIFIVNFELSDPEESPGTIDNRTCKYNYCMYHKKQTSFKIAPGMGVPEAYKSIRINNFILR